MSVTFKDYRLVFQVASLGFFLLAAAPGVSLVVSVPRGGEQFTELWLLGPDRMAEGYPFNVQVGEDYLVYVGLGNHMGGARYYAVYVKWRNQTEPLPNATTSMPSALPLLYEFRALVSEGETWERPVTFSVLEASHYENSSRVDRLSINNRTVSVASSATWDSENRGYYYQLFFELYLYDLAEAQFRFHDRFVGIWLNMTG